jgi:plastocyanin
MRSVSLLLLAILAVGCGGGYGGNITTPPPGDPRTVDAVGVTSWSPATITIKSGEDVTFRNSSSTTHNVQFDQTAGHPANVADFSSSAKAVTFATAGTYAYHCGIHPNMQGQVVVQP